MRKFFRLNSIRDRIQGGFLFLIVLIVALVIFSAAVISQTREIAALHSDINELQVHSLNLIKTDNDFFNQEVYDQHYLKTRESKLIVRRDSLRELISKRIADIVLKSTRLDYPVSHYLNQIDTLFLAYHATFNRLEELFFKRGFKDEGIEGEMRSFAHELESPSSGFDRLELLSLRRSEKDFMIRHDTIYIENFDRQVISILESLSRKMETNGTEKNLASYRNLFLSLATIQKEIGLTADDGLRGQLNNLTGQLSDRYFMMAHDSKIISTEAQRDAWLFFVATTASAVFFSILTGYWISRRISAPIARLSQVMEEAVEKRYHVPKFNSKNAAIEINVLTSSFEKLMNETIQQMKELKKKSALVKKNNQELKKLNNDLDGFLYSTAHDLRAPLTSLLGILNLMKRENQQPELLVYIEMMQKSIHRQDAFISQIVEFTKNKKLTIAPERIDFQALIEEIFESHYYIKGATEIHHRVEVQGETSFHSDINRMKIIFSNLISNAIKYADFEKPKPSIMVSINITEEEASIRFSDNGIGVETFHLDKIFDMFYRANHDSKGSGLGLFIFSETIQKLRGFMTIESTIHMGTSFFIRLPNLATDYQLPFSTTESNLV